MRNKQGGEGRGRSAARADNKFPNIIFSFVPVFSPRIIALLTSLSPLPPFLRIFSFSPIFPFLFFFFFFSASEHAMLPGRSPLENALSRNVFLGIFLRTISQIVPRHPLVAETDL